MNNQESTEFDSFFELSESDDNRQEARMIMYRFLSEIENSIPEKKGIKTKLAEVSGLSKSYITQLFNGDKFINMLTLAKFQKALKIKFNIKAIPENVFNTPHYSTTVKPIEYITYVNCKEDEMKESHKNINPQKLQKASEGKFTTSVTDN